MMANILQAEKFVNAETGFLCRYVRSDRGNFHPHSHEYYELFLVVKGNVCHVVNDKEQQLTEGQLLFIRDFDIHNYELGEGTSFEFINLAFSKEILQVLGNFLGEGFPLEKLLSAAFPPMVSLSAREKERLAHDFIQLNAGTDNAYRSFKAKALLTRIFAEYFFGVEECGADIPFWLENAYEKMKRPQNFKQGAARMYELAGKTREHLTRCMQQYYRVTPTVYVNNLRLEYASNLLLVSNLKTTDICYECGFENLSWFYKVFAAKYGMTPTEYRNQYKGNE